MKFQILQSLVIKILYADLDCSDLNRWILIRIETYADPQHRPGLKENSDFLSSLPPEVLSSLPVLRIRIRDPGSGAFLTPGSGILNWVFPDPGSQTHIFESLLTIFGVKSSIIL